MEMIYVVVPVYKVEPYIHRCIDSILRQTLADFTLILVDDGSPDNCGAICDEYAQQDSRIHVIHQENGGLSAARNAGIDYALAHGDPEKDWINFIDSDDFVHPKYLEYLYRAAKEAGTQISACSYLKTDAAESGFYEMQELKCDVFSAEKYWCKYYGSSAAVVAWGKLYRLSLFRDILYPVGRINEDAFTTHRLVFQCDKIAYVPEKLYFYYLSEDSIMRSSWSPKKLDVLNALDSQTVFFQTNNYLSAYRDAARYYLYLCIKHLMYIKNLSPQYDHLIPDVKAKRNYAFRLYAREFGLWKAVAYWFDFRFARPAKRILGKESVFSFLKRRIKKKLGLR